MLVLIKWTADNYNGHEEIIEYDEQALGKVLKDVTLVLNYTDIYEKKCL